MQRAGGGEFETGVDDVDPALGFAMDAGETMHASYLLTKRSLRIGVLALKIRRTRYLSGNVHFAGKPRCSHARVD
jgi:hypothetical protein